MAWHTVERTADETYRIYEPMGVIDPEIGVGTVVVTANMYLVVGQERAALIDTGMGIGDVRKVVSGLTSLPCEALNTHSHWDHVGANVLFEETSIHELEADKLPLERDISHLWHRLASPAAAGVLPPAFDRASYRIHPRPATRVLKEGDCIDLGGRVIQALHTPGHSPGHTTYLDAANGLLFTGDTAYHGPVFACFVGGDPEAFAQTAERLAGLPGPLTVCPGHNEVIRDPGWLSWFAGCVSDAVAGRGESTWREERIVGREYRFGDLAVWMPT